MAILLLTSTSGAPGVTTLGVGLALCWPRSVLLVDADTGANQAVLAGYLAGTSADVVINDDLRDPHVDAPLLRRHGFRVLRITCDESVRQARLAGRGDPTLADRSTAQLHLIGKPNQPHRLAWK